MQNKTILANLKVEVDHYIGFTDYLAPTGSRQARQSYFKNVFR